MIEKTVRTTEGKLTLKVPTTLQELTIGQLAELENGDLSDIEALSILSYCPVDTLYQIRNIEDIEVFKEAITELIYNMGFLYDANRIPERVTVSGKKVNVVRNLSVEPAGAFLNARNIISDQINECIKKFGEENWQKNFKPSTKSCIELLAQYFYCLVTDKLYNENEVNKFQDEIKYLPVSDALPIATFFFQKFPNLSNQKISFLKLMRILIQERQVLRNLRHSGQLTRLTH